VRADNAFAPSPKVMAKLSHRLRPDRVYLTSESGTITFTTDGQRLWLETERRTPQAKNCIPVTTK
jgi:beta-lactamase superfamily II metal-dependent hydrolase